MPKHPTLSEMASASGMGAQRRTFSAERPHSLSPITDEEPWNEPVALSADQIERRRRLQRIVGAVVAVAAVVTTLAGGRYWAQKAHAHLATSSPATGVLHPAEEPYAPPDLRLLGSSGALQAPAVVPTPPKDARDASTIALKNRARALIEQGKATEGARVAEDAITADPTDAESYLLLGAAFQDLRDDKSALLAFSRCTQTATKGALWECRALGGRPEGN